MDASLATWTGGRVTSSPFNVSFSWEGVQTTFNVSGGTTISVLASSTCPSPSTLFHTIVDGVLQKNFTLGTGKNMNVTVATGLDPALSHTVKIFYATDPIVVSWDKLPPWMHSFQEIYSDGNISPGPPKPSRRLQIIGDSITAGNQINPDTCSDDNLGTYGERLCSHFDADCQTLAISGKGLYVNCCDTDVTMTTLFQRTFVGNPEILWDDSAWVPDGVILALGVSYSLSAPTQIYLF